MQNNLLEQLKAVRTNKVAKLPAAVLSYEDLTNPVGRPFDIPLGYEYKLRLEIGVSIQTVMIDERTIREANRHIARSIYGQYVDELRAWFYFSDAELNLPQDQKAKFFEIIESMEGR